MSNSTLRSRARMLLSIAPIGLKVQISIQEIEKAARRWSRKRCTLPSKCLQEGFVSETVAWLSFLGRLQVQTKPAKAYDQMLVEFKAFMEKDRGLPPVTVEHRCHSVRPFLNRLLSEKRSLHMVSVADIDSLLAQKVNEQHPTVCVVAAGVFRYAETRLVWRRHSRLDYGPSCFPARDSTVRPNLAGRARNSRCYVGEINQR